MTSNELITQLINLAGTVLVLTAALVVGFQLLTRVLFERVVVKDIEGKDDAAAGMSGIIRSELLQLQQEGAGQSLFSISGPDEAITLPDNISQGQFKSLAAIVELLPGRISTLEGHIQQKGALGLGLSLQLRGAWNRTMASTTIWDVGLGIVPDEPSDAERYQRLALSASAWLAYQLVASRGPRDRVVLLTQDWTSYALFLVAVRMRTQGVDADGIRAVLQGALSRDPRNRGALFELAVLYGLEEANGPATQLFDACVREVKIAYDECDDAWALDRLWYRATLNGAITRLNEVDARRTRTTSTVPGAVVRVKPGAPGDELLLSAAFEGFWMTAIKAQETITRLVGSQPPVSHGRYGDLVRFLVQARDYAIANCPAPPPPPPAPATPAEAS